VLPVGRLGDEQVTARGLAFPFRRASMGGDVTDALVGRAFVDRGGAFVCGGGLVVAIQLASVCLAVTFGSELGELRGTLDVLLRHAAPGGKFRLPTQQLLGTLGGLVTP
jgi:hypothetical protein